MAGILQTGDVRVEFAPHLGAIEATCPTQVTRYHVTVLRQRIEEFPCAVSAYSTRGGISLYAVRLIRLPG